MIAKLFWSVSSQPVVIILLACHTRETPLTQTQRPYVPFACFYLARQVNCLIFAGSHNQMCFIVYLDLDQSQWQ